MLKIRNFFLMLLVVLSAAACAVYPAGTTSSSVSVGVAGPHASIGFSVSSYPYLTPVPGYPVYYAPSLQANFFFYDSLFWVYQDDYWYSSSWYNGPWWRVHPEVVPVIILQVPVRYYRHPPTYFQGWRQDAPPRWGDRWGRDWEHNRSGWDRYDRRSAPAAAPLPDYQRHYSDQRYPRQVEQQFDLRERNYRYQPRDPVVKQQYDEQKRGRGPGQQRR
jgi:hypothetical protein